MRAQLVQSVVQSAGIYELFLSVSYCIVTGEGNKPKHVG